ncbi:hypothetical protein D3C86_1657420 [compost metagenome]
MHWCNTSACSLAWASCMGPSASLAGRESSASSSVTLICMRSARRRRRKSSARPRTTMPIQASGGLSEAR